MPSPPPRDAEHRPGQPAQQPATPPGQPTQQPAPGEDVPAPPQEGPPVTLVYIPGENRYQWMPVPGSGGTAPGQPQQPPPPQG